MGCLRSGPGVRVAGGLAVIILIGFVSAQRGCPQEGCDSRGLNCQADFQINGKDAEIIWRTNVGGNITMSAVKALGCVGNNMNVVCRGGNGHSSGYVSINSTTGAIRWYDTLLTKPRLPIMNQAGAIIAADPQYMELRLSNGSLVGKPRKFIYYPITNISSIHYVQEPNLYFFLGMKEGGLYLYDAEGICDASMFLDVKDNVTNHTVSVWLPISRVVVTQETDPPTAYFIAQDNITSAYRLVALNFNKEPPILSQKWYIELNTSLDMNTVSGVQLMALNGQIYLGGGLIDSSPNMLIVTDEGTNGVIARQLDVFTQSFASLDFPGMPKDEDDPEPLIWMNTMTANMITTVQAWRNSDSGGDFLYSFNLYEHFKLQITMLTSQIMVFGYHPYNQTVVFAFIGMNWGGAAPTEPGGYQAGCYLVAIKPNPADGSVDMLWSKYVGSGVSVVGQIIGVNDNMLIAQGYDGDTDTSEIMGIRISL